MQPIIYYRAIRLIFTLSFFLFFSFYFLFLLVGGKLLYNIIVVFAIH